VGDEAIFGPYHARRHTPVTGQGPTTTGRPSTRADRVPSLLVSEIFGPTIQGEGLGLGLPAVFLRLAGCPLSCSWCDTAYAWDWSKFDKTTNTRRVGSLDAWNEVRGLVGDSPTRTLVITGGEPASQASALLPVAQSARAAGWRVEMETSGSIYPGELMEWLTLVTVSPKLSSAGMNEKVRLNPAVLTPLSTWDSVVWKFVIDSPADLDEVDDVVTRLGLPPDRVMLMSQATTAAEVLDRTRWVTPAAIGRGYRVTTRLHVLLWGNEQGR
jgi:7-carboxy-7-deazaguanine synthase